MMLEHITETLTRDICKHLLNFPYATLYVQVTLVDIPESLEAEKYLWVERRCPVINARLGPNYLETYWGKYLYDRNFVPGGKWSKSGVNEWVGWYKSKFADSHLELRLTIKVSGTVRKGR